MVAAPRTCPCPGLLSQAIITNPKAFPPAARRRLGLLIDKYVTPAGATTRRRGRRG
jgi:hypothetical protein